MTMPCQGINTELNCRVHQGVHIQPTRGSANQVEIHFERRQSERSNGMLVVLRAYCRCGDEIVDSLVCRASATRNVSCEPVTLLVCRVCKHRHVFVKWALLSPKSTIGSHCHWHYGRRQLQFSNFSCYLPSSLFRMVVHVLVGKFGNQSFQTQVLMEHTCTVKDAGTGSRQTFR